MAYVRFCVFLRQSIKVAFMACQKAFRLTWSVVPMCLCQTHLRETPTDACDGWQVLTEELAKEKHQKQVPGQWCVFFYICSRTPMGGWVNKNGGTCGKRAVSPWTFWISHGLTRRHGWWFDYVRLIKIWFNDPTWGFFEKNGGEEDTYFEMLPCSFLRLQLTSPCLNINIMQEHAWDMYLW